MLEWGCIWVDLYKGDTRKTMSIMVSITSCPSVFGKESMRYIISWTEK